MSSSTEDKRHKVLAVSVVFFGISLGSIVVRIFTRMRLLKFWGGDDVLIVFAGLGATGMLVGVVVGKWWLNPVNEKTLTE
jgi:hypothetical protein